jgi:hypothetical protein
MPLLYRSFSEAAWPCARTHLLFRFNDLLVEPRDLKVRQKRTQNRNASSGPIHHLHHLRRNAIETPHKDRVYLFIFDLSVIQ